MGADCAIPAQFWGQWRVDAEWIKSPTARRILMHWADPRPAWLWSQDGATLIWRNAAARLFNARLKKSGLKLSPEAVPIRGQVARLIRLGSPARSSLARVQFLAADHPVAATCSCTPLNLADGQMALLLVSVDRIAPDVVEAAGGFSDDWSSRRLLPPGASYVLVEDGKPTRGDAEALSRHAGTIEKNGLPGESESVLRVKASPGDSWLLLYLNEAAPASIAEVRAEEGASADDQRIAPEDDLAHMPEPMLPLGLEALPPTEPLPPVAADQWVEPISPVQEDRQLSSLFDRLASDTSLYGALSAADEVFTGPAAELSEQTIVPPAEEPPIEAATQAPTDEPGDVLPDEEPPPLDSELLGSVIEYADDPEAPLASPPLQESSSLWMITGRGFRAIDRKPVVPPPAAPEPEPEPIPAPAVAQVPTLDAAPLTVDAAPDAEAAERVSRYNFEELGRILTDRVSGDATRPESTPAAPPLRPIEGVVNLSAETLVLNRLPLAILVFRDQQVLFANRALTDLLGYDSVATLRNAGIAAIFPIDEGANAGPVNRLVRRDGSSFPVSARLQSVSWQGRAALMLSASPAEPIRTHEVAVRAFAEIAADAREEGFVAADRAGTITLLSGHGGVLLGRPAEELIGKPLALLVGKPDMEPLRQFLEKPARFAETARPSIALGSEDGNADLLLFAEGQAGVVTGYFGFLRRRTRIAPAPAAGTDSEIEPGMLGRLSRGIRGPLNTIIGFADLIRAASAGHPGQERHAEYARDIRTAGLEIAVLADELDDFTRLRDGRYAPRPADVELGPLLDSCMLRVRSQAAGARVLVRSAISERLPRVRADRASLGQALLNLLASAIDQTPVGGSVILSAQSDDEGNIAVHVRDGAESGTDLGERFVVFRDGVDKDGEQLNPVRSSVGLALTRSLLAVNACTLSVDPTAGTGTLFSLLIPAELVVRG